MLSTCGPCTDGSSKEKNGIPLLEASLIRILNLQLMFLEGWQHISSPSPTPDKHSAIFSATCKAERAKLITEALWLKQSPKLLQAVMFRRFSRPVVENASRYDLFMIFPLCCSVFSSLIWSDRKESTLSFLKHSYERKYSSRAEYKASFQYKAITWTLEVKSAW